MNPRHGPMKKFSLSQETKGESRVPLLWVFLYEDIEETLIFCRIFWDLILLNMVQS